MTVVATIICLLELYNGLQQSGYRPRSIVGILCALLLLAAIIFQEYTHYPLVPIALSASIILSLTAELLVGQENDPMTELSSWALSFSGAIYIGWLLSYFVLLRQMTTPLHTGWLDFLRISPGAAWIYFALAVIWLQDAGAYFVGRAFGKHKMAPIISPKKTWEGAAGGIVTAVLSAMLAVLLLGLPVSYPVAALIGLVGGVVAMVGDLVESLIKRRIGIKDMGTIMPGHGGILDRADSMLFAAPVLYYLIVYFT